MKIVQIVTSIFIIWSFCLFSSCNEKKFNAENSDPKAIEVADKVMEAMGGEDAWNNTRHIRWNFFDSRSHFWDKKTGDIRIESLKDDLIILMNINKMKGKVLKEGAEISDPDSLSKYLESGRNWWINDSYWLVMPYKLKDPGVTLKYIGEESSEAGTPTDIIQLTFEEVGVTPENKYWVYVDKTKNLVTKWAYYKTATQEEPDFMMPWDNYQKFDEIMLSDDRGRGKMSNIGVFKTVPKEVYTSFSPVNL